MAIFDLCKSSAAVTNKKLCKPGDMIVRRDTDVGVELFVYPAQTGRGAIAAIMWPHRWCVVITILPPDSAVYQHFDQVLLMTFNGKLGWCELTPGDWEVVT